MLQEQISSLPKPKRVITGVNAEGKAIIHSNDDFLWDRRNEDTTGLSVVYTTSSFPPDLSEDRDLKTHETVISGQLGLVNAGGTVLRCVECAPGYTSPMHRTKSLDYGIIVEGEIYMVLDSGEEIRLKRGDIAIQRATQHAWANRSASEWARMVFVLQDCRVPEGVTEDLGEAHGLIPPSGN